MITIHDHETMYRLKMLDFKVKHGLNELNTVVFDWHAEC